MPKIRDVLPGVLAGGLVGELLNKDVVDPSTASLAGGLISAFLAKKRKTNQDDYEPAMKDSGTGRVSVESSGLNGKAPEGIVRGSGK